jgi:NADH-quinone oxidoreductase subunit N
MFFYLGVYSLATLGIFAALAYLSSEEHEVSRVSELSGLGRAHPWVAGARTIGLFSLAGIPPLAGFWGKLTLFTGAVRLAMSGQAGLAPWFLTLAVVGVLNAAVAAAYYLRVISTMYFTPSVVRPQAKGGAGWLLVMATCSLLGAIVGLLPGPALHNARLSDPVLQQARARAATVLKRTADKVTMSPRRQVTSIRYGVR